MCVFQDHLDSPLDLLSIDSAGHLDELGPLKSICQNRRVENVQTVQLVGILVWLLNAHFELSAVID